MIIFSRVVNSRWEMGSLSSFAFFLAPPTDVCPFPFEPPTGEVKELVDPVMVRMRDHRILGYVD